LLDRFVDSNGTNLTAHTPDIGPGWTVANTTWYIQSNSAQINTFAGPSDGLAWMDTGVADVHIRLAIQFPGTGSVYGICFRMTDGSNGYECFYNRTTTVLDLYKQVAGVYTLLNSTSLGLPANNPAILDVYAYKSIILCEVNGQAQIPFFDTTFLTQTKHGIMSQVSVTFPNRASGIYFHVSH
jgi:hypothetical protein